YPLMREARARPIARRVVARAERHWRGPVGNYRAALVNEPESLPDAVQVIVHIIDSKCDLIRIARANRLGHQRKAKRILQAEVRVRFRDRLALDAVAIQQPLRRPSAK